MSDYKEQYRRMDETIRGEDSSLAALPAPKRLSADELRTALGDEGKNASDEILEQTADNVYQEDHDAFVARAMKRPAASWTPEEKAAVAAGIRAALRESAD